MAKKINLREQSTLNKQKKQLDLIQQVADLLVKQKQQKAGGTSTPSSLATPSPTDLPVGLNAAQIGGASGIGFEDASTQDKISEQVKATVQSGGSKSQTGDSISSSQASSLVKSAGLDGLLDSKMFLGKSFGQAAQLIQQEKAKRSGQVSANTSFAFNPETLKKTQRAIDKFNFALDEADNNPFEPKKFKTDNKNNVLEVTSKELGGLFNNAEEIYSAYKFNPQFKATLDKFIQKGGTIEGIAKNVSAPAAAQNDTFQQGQGVYKTNPDGTATLVSGTGAQSIPAPTGNVQSPSDYLAGLRNPQANQQAEQQAIDELAPESAIAQDEIARNARIPQELKSLYFGDEKSIGIVQMRREQAQEESRVLEEKEKDAKATAKDKAELQIARNKADAKIQTAKIEENRLAAKNYMTAKLASLGALQTTGAAVLAIQTLETKYQQQSNQLESSLKLANRAVEIGLTEDINVIENDTDDKILKIQEDLTKSSEEIAKEVLKAQNDADKQIYTTTEQYARRLRERTTKYTEDMKAAAEKYAKEYAKIASGGIDFTAGGNVSSKSKIVSTIENILEGSRGDDTYVNSEIYKQQLKKWIERGGTTKTFVAAFPPKLYANPDDTTLPASLKYARESQTTKAASTDDVDAAIEAWVNDQEDEE